MPRQWLRRIGAGRLAYHAWHAPLGAIGRSLAEGGPIEQWRTARGRRAMQRAAATLPPLTAPPSRPLELHLLTGRHFWDQTAFCLWTFARTAQRPVHPVLYDDGTLPETARTALAQVFPTARFVHREAIRAALDAHLPANRFPVLRDRWRHYPNIRKLIDIHLGQSGWKLVLDSDLLFFRPPTCLVHWLDSPTRPLHAVDVENAYGYPIALLSALAGAPVRARVNVGLCGLRSDSLDWDRIESWCRTLIARHGTSYYLEQALVATLTAGQECTVAPAGDYVTCPQPPEAGECRAVMHHYVAGSKTWYFRHNWRRALGA